MHLIESIAVTQDEITQWRRDIHTHPELGFEEHRTAQFVAQKLREFGCDVHTGIGRTGVVGVLRAGHGTGTIGLRADMDALPIQEANTFAHRSSNPGAMHACGHDGHTSMLLAAAQYLSKSRRFNGTVHFIFQPAEEGLGGAQAMIADRLFERFPCDSIFGMHNRPGLALGKFAVRSGPMMAGGAFFDIDIIGKGAHGARPETGVDSVVVAAHMTTALQSIVARNIPPVETAVVSVTMIHAGDAYNVIPHTARLSGTVRAFSREVMARVEQAMRRIAQASAQTFGAEAKVDFRFIFSPTVNNAEAAEFAAGICAEVVGTENVERNPPLIMASEDFSFMLEQVPGCYFNIGNGAGAGSCEVHNPGYDFNDEALPLGATVFARIVETKLRL